MALDVYEESLCPDCAQDTTRSHDPDMDGWYEVHETTCMGCQTIEDHTKNSEQPRSVKLYLTDEGPADLQVKRPRTAAPDRPAS